MGAGIPPQQSAILGFDRIETAIALAGAAASGGFRAGGERERERKEPESQSHASLLRRYANKASGDRTGRP
jgi:hypothetical protein